MDYIGMDVHSKVTMVCVLDENGKVAREHVFKGSLRDLVVRLKDLKGELGGTVKICYEASCGCGWLFDKLTGMGFSVQVAHPGKLRMIFRSKRKNDRVDARKLATLLFLDQVPLAHVPPADVRAWRALIEYRGKLVGQRGSAKNRMRAILRSNGILAPRGLWTAKGLGWLVAQELSEFEAIQREMLLEELSQVQAKIKRVESVLKKRADKEPSVCVLKTIPGVGIRTAEAFVAYIDKPERFRRNKSVGCYFGMVPCEDTSVKSRFGHITKEGPATVRKLVVEAAWQSIRRDKSMKEYYERVCRRDPNRRKIALVATAHHLLRVMHSMLVSGETWRGSVPAETTGEAIKQPA
jgi:transposase